MCVCVSQYISKVGANVEKQLKKLLLCYHCGTYEFLPIFQIRLRLFEFFKTFLQITFYIIIKVHS